jgi:hypothetical protein
MKKSVQVAIFTVIWLLASPSLQFGDAERLEVGAPPAIAEPAKDVKKKPAKRTRKPTRLGSTPIISSNAPGLYPMQPITPPKMPDVTGTVIIGAPVPGYPNVPTVVAIPVPGGETSQGRVARCAHQGALGGLPAGQQGAYIHNCAFQ